MMLEEGTLLSGTCSGPSELAASPEETSIEAGTLMSLYKVGVLGVCFPTIKPARTIVARISGASWTAWSSRTGDFIGTSSERIPGRLCLEVRLDDPDAFLESGAIGNHYTFLPTDELDRDIARIEALCGLMGNRDTKGSEKVESVVHFSLLRAKK